MTGTLTIFVDAGFRNGAAGLGVWIPAVGTGVSLTATACDNNEAETLAIVLGIVIARLMALEGTRVVTDSLLNRDRLDAGTEPEGTLGVAYRALASGRVGLEWRPREETGLPDFFAGLGLAGKSLVARTANARNPADKFRALARAERRDKTPVKDVTITWLTLPGAPKAPFDAKAEGLEDIAPGIGGLLGVSLPVNETRELVAVFRRRMAARS